MRYYLHARTNVWGYDNSQIVDEIGNKIPFDLAKIVKNLGGKNIRWSRHKGYSNQPKVLTFSCDNLENFDRGLDNVQINGRILSDYLMAFEKV